MPGSGSVAWRVGAESSSFNDCGCISYDQWPEGLLFSVPKGKVSVDMLVADSSAELDENGLIIEEGRDCPYVYSFNKILECTSSEAIDTIVLHKKFALLFCYVRGGDGLKGGIMYEFSGNVNGYNVDGCPNEGAFRYVVRMEKASRLQEIGCVSLPAQTDGSLRLNLYSYEGMLIRSFAIGEYICQSGYDWSAEDLKDIQIEIDLVNSSIWLFAREKNIRYFNLTL